jgi:hypothetical protein
MLIEPKRKAVWGERWETEWQILGTAPLLYPPHHLNRTLNVVRWRGSREQLSTARTEEGAPCLSVPCWGLWCAYVD